jgi:predicted nucleic acid-binding protein
VIDDQGGRKAARHLGIAVSGVVGVLLKAKQDGHLPLVCPVLETILRHGYWLSDALIEAAARLAGEASSHP